ncbi:FAD-dependent oxidoreductase [Fusibacter ferrireducens]|uniref:FAD-dependent oxidoreductase n=1 Tax=Fusibacter ferrireducens TaxID=2785058 RepID=A0ABR9ZPZ6_9FIRM|nr:FAD-dependent oxidoreductase [Fusibacter ferrireducens]MBF4692542.1 FAD-dependent oxidoreductase [Fusibacter ferrireducens]
MSKVIMEPSRQIPILDEADVVVIGSGPAGHSAAVAAARSGAGKVILVERYNHLGGMATGGFVLLVPHLSFGGTIMSGGLQQEWIDRMEKLNYGAVGPTKESVGSVDPELIQKWAGYWGFVLNDNINYGAYLDPDQLKVVLDEMINEQGEKITTYLHGWAVGAVMDGDAIKGVIIESKEGRQAIMGKVVIDCTGDADICAFAGGGFDEDRDKSLRSASMAAVYRLGGVDFKHFADWKVKNFKEWYEVHMANMAKITGFKMSPHATPRNDQCWINNWIPKYCLNIKDLTSVDMSVRKTMYEAIDYLKENIPGFKDAFLIDIAPQTGTRGSRRIHGMYKLTKDDLDNTYAHEDTISVVPPFNFGVCQTPTEIPYRVMVPVKIENLLVAGRSFSSSHEANDWSNLIPHCANLGHAAGVAAAIAIKDGTSVRDVNIQKVQTVLKDQNTYLPR